MCNLLSRITETHFWHTVSAITPIINNSKYVHFMVNFHLSTYQSPLKWIVLEPPERTTSQSNINIITHFYYFLLNLRKELRLIHNLNKTFEDYFPFNSLSFAAHFPQTVVLYFINQPNNWSDNVFVGEVLNTF